MSEYRVMLHEPSTIHHTALLGDGTVVYAYATIAEGVQIGKGCVVGACSFIGPHCRIGDGTRLHHGAALAAGSVIGERAYIGTHVTLIDVRYPNLRDKDTEDHRPPVVEDDAVVGCGAVLLPGVVIGRGAIVGAGAVVTRDVHPGAVVAGNPARPLASAAWRREVLSDGSSLVR